MYVDPRYAVAAAGLGEVGLGGFILTPEFGTRQRFAFILTDAELEGDAVRGKTVCGDCGGFFGQKVWHSNDPYRKVIWRCNSKFKGEKKCTTPHLDTETVQQKFLIAYNHLMENRDGIVSDCELMRQTLSDCTALDTEIDRLTEEIEVVAEMVFRILKFRPPSADAAAITVPAAGPSGRIVDASAYAGGVLRPVISRDTAFYWEGAKIGELHVGPPGTSLCPCAANGGIDFGCSASDSGACQFGYL